MTEAHPGPTDAAPIVTIFGGSGFVGRYVAQRMARRGWRARVAVRRPNEALFVRDDASCRRAIEGAQAVVYSVGVLAQMGANSFKALQAQGPERVARLAAALGVERLVLISAIGADLGSPAEYARTKAQGEIATLKHFPKAVILRPSIVFGPEDEFFNRFAAMARVSPVLPVVGGATRFQPVYVGDVAEAAEKALTGGAEEGATYELGGPRVATFRELMELMLKVIRRKRAVLDIPIPVAKLQGLAFEQLARIGIAPPMTLDQVRMLARDNVVDPKAKTLADLGVAPTAMEAVLETYLYAYRPKGQFDRPEDAAGQA